MLKTQKNQILYPHLRKPHFWNLPPFQGIVNGTSQNWQPFQGRRISRMPKTTINWFKRFGSPIWLLTLDGANANNSQRKVRPRLNPLDLAKAELIGPYGPSYTFRFLLILTLWPLIIHGRFPGKKHYKRVFTPVALSNCQRIQLWNIVKQWNPCRPCPNWHYIAQFYVQCIDEINVLSSFRGNVLLVAQVLKMPCGFKSKMRICIFSDGYWRDPSTLSWEKGTKWRLQVTTPRWSQVTTTRRDRCSNRCSGSRRETLHAHALGLRCRVSENQSRWWWWCSDAMVHDFDSLSSYLPINAIPDSSWLKDIERIGGILKDIDIDVDIDWTISKDHASRPGYPIWSTRSSSVDQGPCSAWALARSSSASFASDFLLRDTATQREAHSLSQASLPQLQLVALAPQLAALAPQLVALAPQLHPLKLPGASEPWRNHKWSWLNQWSHDLILDHMLLICDAACSSWHVTHVITLKSFMSLATTQAKWQKSESSMFVWHACILDSSCAD